MLYKAQYKFAPNDWRTSVNTDLVRSWFYPDLPACQNVENLSKCKVTKYVKFKNSLTAGSEMQYRVVPMEGTQ